MNAEDWYAIAVLGVFALGYIAGRVSASSAAHESVRPYQESALACQEAALKAQKRARDAFEKYDALYKELRRAR